MTLDTAYPRVFFLAPTNRAQNSAFLMNLFPVSLELFLNPERLVTVRA